jgi:hypothetical protein
MLYEMMAGALPFGEAQGSPFSQALRQLQTSPVSLGELRGDLPVEVVEIVMACLASDQAQRPDLERIERTLLTWGQTFEEPVWPPPNLPEREPGRAMASTLSAEESGHELPPSPSTFGSRADAPASTIKPTYGASDASEPATRSEGPPRKMPQG